MSAHTYELVTLGVDAAILVVLVVLKWMIRKQLRVYFGDAES